MSQRLDVPHDLSARIGAEYREMPGLRLTLAQASRLWNTDRATIQPVLDRMVASAFLRLSGGAYVRANSGRRSA